MLPKGPLDRIRYCTQNRGGQISRSCNASPYHAVRSSLSTNSLKRRSNDSVCWANSPNKQISVLQGGAMANYVPYVEVEMIMETEEGKSGDEKEPALSLHNGPMSLSNISTKPISNCTSEANHVSSWKNNYVPCIGVNSFLQREVVHEPKENTPINKHFHSSSSMRRKRKLCHRIRDEFTLTNFKFDHLSPHLFVTSQWQQPDQMCCIYLAYRLFWGVYFTMWGIWSWIGFGGYDAAPSIKPYYVIFLTNWGIWLLAFDAMFQAINVSLHMKKIAEDGESKYLKMKTSFKISWILSNITATLHIFITMMFWTTIFPYGTYDISAISVNTHIVPGIYIILDCLISATPRRIFHAYLPMVLSTVYGIFSNIYYISGGKNHKGSTNLYPILDWSEHAKTLLTGSALVLLLIPFIHIVIVCVLYGFRVNLWRSLNYTRSDLQSEMEQFKSMEEKV